ncbi:transposase [Nonomuraea dietziae]|uniref:transposase n=1 Tax=Nonomuraea dietziae TaxID=65515 RepID=UPI003F4D5E5F
MARFDVTDAEWALIEPHLPVAATEPLPRRVRDQFNGILWRFRTGSDWRDVPARYGPWSTLYSRFNGCAKAGAQGPGQGCRAWPIPRRVRQQGPCRGRRRRAGTGTPVA